jgi:hypothetical protein
VKAWGHRASRRQPSQQSSSKDSLKITLSLPSTSAMSLASCPYGSWDSPISTDLITLKVNRSLDIYSISISHRPQKSSPCSLIQLHPRSISSNHVQTRPAGPSLWISKPAATSSVRVSMPGETMPHQHTPHSYIPPIDRQSKNTAELQPQSTATLFTSPTCLIVASTNLILLLVPSQSKYALVCHSDNGV